MSYSFSLNNTQIQKLIKKYFEYKQVNTTEYMLFRAKIDYAIMTIYKTNKVLIQGNSSEKLYNDILSYLDIESTVTNTTALKPKNNIDFNFSIIGTDEVGTGDYFGPILVCACFVPTNKIVMLKNLGVMDSKKINDEKILKLAPELMKLLTYSVVSLNNEQYNKISKTTNMNKIKAILHNNAINKILLNDINFDKVIIDGFTTSENYFKYLNNTINVYRNVELITKGEEKFIAVAAASVIARYHFLNSMDKLSKIANYNLPKGAGKPVDEMLTQIIRDNNKEMLLNIAKLNFKNTSRIKP